MLNGSAEALLSKCRLECADDVVVELLPREGVAVGVSTKVATGSRDPIDGSRQAKVADDVAGFEREVGGNEVGNGVVVDVARTEGCLLYTSPSPRDYAASRMPSSA